MEVQEQGGRWCWVGCWSFHEDSVTGNPGFQPQQGREKKEEGKWEGREENGKERGKGRRGKGKEGREQEREIRGYLFLPITLLGTGHISRDSIHAME